MGFGCTGAGSRSAPESGAVKQEYLELQQQAVEELRAWGAAGGGAPDPRPAWAARLEAFAHAHPDASEGADALAGAMEQRAARQDAAGFFADYDLMLQLAPDGPQLPRVFNQVQALRIVEEGGYGIMTTADTQERDRARARAAPKIIKDLERAIEATRTPGTKAAAHYIIGLTLHQIVQDEQEALKHFKAVVGESPDAPSAASAAGYIREIEILAVGKRAPDFETQTIDGQKTGLASMNGSIVVLDFWASWSQPCLERTRELKRIQKRYRQDGVVLIGISLDTDLATAEEYLSDNHVTWPTVASGKGMQDPVARSYGVQALPVSYLIGRDGTIQDRLRPGDDVDRAVSRLIER
jgi:peroxiredoxin